LFQCIEVLIARRQICFTVSAAPRLILRYDIRVGQLSERLDWSLSKRSHSCRWRLPAHLRGRYGSNHLRLSGPNLTTSKINRDHDIGSVRSARLPQNSPPADARTEGGEVYVKTR